MKIKSLASKFFFLGIAALALSIANPVFALTFQSHVKATLVSDVTSIQPGQPFMVAVRLRMEGTWHTYWKNAGESGSPTEIHWTLPDGFEASPIEWPTPVRIAVPPVVSYGFLHEVMLPVTIRPPATLKPRDRITLNAKVDWLECDTLCVPGSGNVSLTLPVSAGAAAMNATEAAAFAALRASLPLKNSGWTAIAQRTADGFHLILSPPAGFSGIIPGGFFFAEDAGVIDYSDPQRAQWKDGALHIDIKRSDTTEAPPTALRGIVVAESGWHGAGTEKTLAVEAPIRSGGAANNTGLLTAILLSFVGGLILNLMPCVLPIISIKILGFVNQAHGDQKDLLKHGLIFAAGVIVSFWILAGALLSFRAAGQELGWGFQLQSPAVIAGLALLFTAIALNLLGLFEFGVSLTRLGSVKASGSGGSANAFLSGVLATLVATPCTAPFMGSALGFALTQPPAVAFAVFTSLAMGMASPYVLLTAQPRWLRFVPKPGAWMDTMKNIMGFFLMATVVWLLWVLAAQVSAPALVRVVSALTLEGAALWIFGKGATPLQRPLVQRAAILVTLIFFLMSAAIAFTVVAAPKPGTVAAGDALPYDPATIEKLRAEGRPVFVDFTAAWCLTCQVNERVVLRSEEIQSAFRNKNVAVMKADWTNRDDRITQALASFDRSGVPYYVLYPADSTKAPIPLSELLTKSAVLKALSQLS